jgi:hypothetical protein
MGFPGAEDCIGLGLPVFWGTQPNSPPPSRVLAGRRVLMLDISFPPDEFSKIAGAARLISVLDHHDTSGWILQDIQINRHDRIGSNTSCGIDFRMCGAEMAWKYAQIHATPGHNLPENVPRGEGPLLLKFIAAQDLWLWESRHANSRNVCAALDAESLTTTLELLTTLLHADAGTFAELNTRGANYRRYQQTQIAQSCARAWEATLHIGRPARGVSFGTDATALTIWAVNCTENISGVGNALCQQKLADGTTPDAAAVYISNQGCTTVSLRAGADSSIKLGQIARALRDTNSGGGHDKASGFSFDGSNIRKFLRPRPSP